MIDAAEADITDGEAHAQLGAIEAACAAVPVYSELLSARQRYMGMLPYVAAKHALRGWEGESLPAFAARLGVVPDDLLEVLPPEEVEMVGWRASALMQPGRAALGNSASPSLSSASPAPVTGASSQRTAGAGRSRAKSTKRTRA
ncbi:hypothetical protein [Roseococcus pinisoli]|uniref:Uncharacterized protein n=1 Tax=Roseococcus pinisoli TaxID=2835040 RepID=A0ABS5QAH5_9PROT|nr:hypothetical protein [Roseococcus pinisoli]MBS7810534.1 hypothetical protein [Roseococcus pinisoli]